MVYWYFSAIGEFPVTKMIGKSKVHKFLYITELQEGYYFCYYEKLIEENEIIEASDQYIIAKTQLIVYGMLICKIIASCMPSLHLA